MFCPSNLACLSLSVPHESQAYSLGYVICKTACCYAVAVLKVTQASVKTENFPHKLIMIRGSVQRSAVLCTASVVLSVCFTHRFGNTGCCVCIVILFSVYLLAFFTCRGRGNKFNMPYVFVYFLEQQYWIISVVLSCFRLHFLWQQLIYVNFSTYCRAPAISGALANPNYNIAPNSGEQRKNYLCMFSLLTQKKPATSGFTTQQQ